MTLNQRKSIYFITATLGLLLGLLLYAVQPVKYESSALVTLGQITSSQTPQPSQTTPIESAYTVSERLKTLSFVNDVAKRAHRPEIASLLNHNDGAGLTVKHLKNGESIIITVTGKSPDLVQVSIDAVVAELISKHKLIIDDYRADTLSEISKLDHEINAITKQVSAPQTLENYKVRSSMLRLSISSNNIRPTRLLEPALVTEKKIFPSPWRASLLGALLGIFFGAIWVQYKK